MCQLYPRDQIYIVNFKETISFINVKLRIHQCQEIIRHLNLLRMLEISLFTQNIQCNRLLKRY